VKNNMEIHIFAYISKEHQNNNICWARLSPDNSNTGGIFLLLYQELSKSSLFDYWFEDMDKAQAWANKYLGIKVEDWRTRESLEQEGFRIIDEK
jgi:hypothetical protein